ncbi:hypothetical protein ACRRTK_009121 [Alexandromys fortis]
MSSCSFILPSWPKKGSSGKAPGATKSVSYRTTPSGLQIMPMKKAQNGLENGDAGSEKEEVHFGNGSHQLDLDLSDQVGEQDASDCDGTHSALVENGVGSIFIFGGSDPQASGASGNTFWAHNTCTQCAGPSDGPDGTIVVYVCEQGCWDAGDAAAGWTMRQVHQG